MVGKKKFGERMSQKEKKTDPFLRLKYIAFCRNYTALEDSGYEDLVNYAKNYICFKKKLLYFDPLWATYSNEAILVEFYSLKMFEDDGFRQIVEKEIRNNGQSEANETDWMFVREKEEDLKREARIKALKEEVDFSMKVDGEKDNGS